MHGGEEGDGQDGKRATDRIRVVIVVRPFFILRIVRPRIFESKFRNHCAKKLDGALRKSLSFV